MALLKENDGNLNNDDGDHVGVHDDDDDDDDDADDDDGVDHVGGVDTALDLPTLRIVKPIRHFSWAEQKNHIIIVC